ncbi:MAG TPA: hypothetical protein VGR96_05260 [Acidobacteriaceae bacterium]|nr:hypothetical protein [Acidobacteriaceae bacterium]
MRRPAFFLLGLLSLFGTLHAAEAQSGLLNSWEARVRKTVATQPPWVVPVVTPSSGLVQLSRFDAVRQINSNRTTSWNYGNSKGFSLIPWYKTELDIGLPSYLEHNSSLRDGAGDWLLLLKYRLLAAGPAKGNYSISASLAGTAPTGSYKNGSSDGSVAPALYGGKGFGRFDVQSSLTLSLPTGHTAKIGRPVAWNAVAQYHPGSVFWPEIEFNSTFFHGGPNDGKTQTFITPGLMISKIALSREETSRLAFIFGGGFQIATSQFHSYDHGIVATGRISF